MSLPSMFTPSASGSGYGDINKSGAGQWFRNLGLNIRGTNEESILSRMLMAALMPQLGQSLELGNQLQGFMPGIAAHFAPGNRASLAAEGTNAAFSNAARAAGQTDAAARSLGLGSGARAGNTAAAFNQAAAYGNDLSRQYNSPAYMQQLAALYQAMMQSPSLSMFAGLTGGRNYQKPVKSQGFLGSLLPALGQFVGMGALGGLPGHGGAGMERMGIGSLPPGGFGSSSAGMGGYSIGVPNPFGGGR